MKRSVKFSDDAYLDSSGIMHNKKLLSNIINNYDKRLLLEFKGFMEIENFNDYYRPGIYGVSGVGLLNAPTSGYIYGVMVVITNDGDIWRTVDTASWMWQFLFTTGGAIYMRVGINSKTPGDLKQIH